MLYSRLLGVWLSLCLAFMLTKESWSNQQQPLSELADRKPSCTERQWYLHRTPVCRRIVGLSVPHNASHVPLASCPATLPVVQEQDTEASRLNEAFLELLTRYDCSQPYSIKFSCQDCQEAYRVWVCSTRVEYWVEERSVRPCRSLCHAVEQKCPFFLPLDKSPSHYAGEPSFLCLDPHIEETREQQKNSMYGADSCCYEFCKDKPENICLRGTCSSGRTTAQRSSTTTSSGGVTLSRPRPPPCNNLLIPLLTFLLLYRTRVLI